jgi:hypothetical protein
MAGLVPAIHVGTCSEGQNFQAAVGRETLSSSDIGALFYDVDARDKLGHDAERLIRPPIYLAVD